MMHHHQSCSYFFNVWHTRTAYITNHINYIPINYIPITYIHLLYPSITYPSITPTSSTYPSITPTSSTYPSSTYTYNSHHLQEQLPFLRGIVEGGIRQMAYYIQQDPWACAFSLEWKHVQGLNKDSKLWGMCVCVVVYVWLDDSGNGQHTHVIDQHTHM